MYMSFVMSVREVFAHDENFKAVNLIAKFERITVKDREPDSSTVVTEEGRIGYVFTQNGGWYVSMKPNSTHIRLKTKEGASLYEAEDACIALLVEAGKIASCG